MDIPNCKICSDSFNLTTNLPIILPVCGHTFCKKCVGVLWEKNKKNKIICPEDNKEYNNVFSIGELPKNGLITSMLEKQKRKKCFEHNKLSEFYCIDCEVC